MKMLRILLLLACASAQAHIPLTPAILDDAFEELKRAQVAAYAETTTEMQAAAIYEIALAASGLMTLLNDEVQLHGFDQLSLLEDAISTASGLGVDISWSENHQRYFYAGTAYRRYLEVSPQGIYAANSHYALIETSFYLGNAEDLEAILARAATENDFLQRYPEFGEVGRVAMFLAIDYRDIWRIYNAANERESAQHYAKLNRDHLAAISVRYDGSRTADLARTFLQRFEAEIAKPD